MNTMQVVTYFRRIAIWPANAKMIHESVYQGIYLDYIYDWIFSYSTDSYEKLNEVVSDELEENTGVKHCCLHFFRGMGVFSVILVIMLILHLVHLLLKELKMENAIRKYL